VASICIHAWRSEKSTPSFRKFSILMVLLLQMFWEVNLISMVVSLSSTLNDFWSVSISKYFDYYIKCNLCIVSVFKEVLLIFTIKSISCCNLYQCYPDCFLDHTILHLCIPKFTRQFYPLKNCTRMRTVETPNSLKSLAVH
jgi:hypothetical protein